MTTSCVLGVLLMPIAVQAQSAFIPLGELGGDDAFSSATGVSSFEAAGGIADNLIVVGNSQSTRGREAFRWTSSTGMMGLGSLGGTFFFSSAAAIDDAGEAVTGSTSSDVGILAYRWSEASGMTSLGDLPGGPIQSEASAISGDGMSIVGSSRSRTGPAGDEAFLWTSASGMIGLGTLGTGQSSVANAINADGTIIVGSSGLDPESQTPFRWTASGGMEPLEQFPGEVLTSEPLGISADGQTIVGWSAIGTSQVAVRWTDAGIESLGNAPPFEASRLFAQAANEDGSVIIGWGQAGTRLTAMYWTQTDGVRPLADVLTNDFGLDLSGWSLSVALDVTTHAATGRTAIVGSGLNPRGETEAFLAVLDPTPPCRVDIDGDGSLTIFDFLAFQTFFDARDPRADFDDDGLFTVFDFLRFFDAFDDGCN